MLLNVFLFPSLLERQVVEVPYSQFLTMVDGGQVEQVALDETSREIVFIAKDDGGREGYYKTGVWPDDGQRLLAQLQAEEGSPSPRRFPPRPIPSLSFLVSWILPIVIFIVIGELLSRWMMKRMGGLPGGMGNAMTFGKSGAKVYVEEASTGVSFADVAGQDEAKESLMEVVDFLHGPEKYAAIGAHLPKGVLLVGAAGHRQDPAGQRQWPGRPRCPSSPSPAPEFVEMFVGMGAAKVRDLFKQAGRRPPASCSSTRSTPSARSGTPAAWAATTSGSRPSTNCWPRWTALTPARASSFWPPPTGRSPWTLPCCARAGLTGGCRWNCPISRGASPF